MFLASVDQEIERQQDDRSAERFRLTAFGVYRAFFQAACTKRSGLLLTHVSHTTYFAASVLHLDTFIARDDPHLVKPRCAGRVSMLTSTRLSAILAECHQYIACESQLLMFSGGVYGTILPRKYLPMGLARSPRPPSVSSLVPMRSTRKTHYRRTVVICSW
jgi:hypothetical protein